MDKIPIYSPGQIFAGSFLGGPIAAVYFLRSNFKQLGNHAAAVQTLLWGVVFNIAIFASIPFLPGHFPNYVLPLAYSWAARGIASAKQLGKESIAASPQFRLRSNWLVLGLGLAFLAGTLLLWIPLLLVLDHFHAINPD